MSNLQQLAFRAAFALSRPGRAQHLSILIFHRVLPEKDAMRPIETTAAGFEWQMQLLRRHFNVLSLLEAVHLLKAARLPQRAVCVTFDDGYADNATVALPILKRYHIPATIFVAVGYLDGGRMWNDTIIESLRVGEADELDLTDVGLGIYRSGNSQQRLSTAYEIIKASKYLGTGRRDEIADCIASKSGQLPGNLMLTTSQLCDLHKQGIDIGGHTVSHPILSRLAIDEAREEIQHGRERLTDMLGEAPRFFAYPNGRRDLDYTKEHSILVKEAGFEAAVVTNRGVAGRHTDLYQLPRFTPWDKSSTRYLMRMAWNAHSVVRH